VIDDRVADVQLDLQRPGRAPRPGRVLRGPRTGAEQPWDRTFNVFGPLRKEKRLMLCVGQTYFNGTPAACVFYALDIVAPV
jgi:hypothetical protein